MQRVVDADRPTVCVIGAGLSGLLSAKRLDEYGVPFDCFESGDTVGGNWAFGHSGGRSSAYRSLHIDTSKERLRFKDFAISGDYPDFPHHSQVHTYLREFCAAFDLQRHIRFRTTVERCERLPGGGWRVRTDDGTTGTYDVVVVANGHHWDPRTPNHRGRFSGPVIHSHDYRGPTEPLDLIGKRVLVVGFGNSAADIACELSQRSVGATVVISTRSGGYVVPKYLAGRPLDSVLRTIPWLPLAPQRKLLQAVRPLLFGSVEHFGLPTPNHRFLEAHPTISGELLLRLGSGDATVRPDVAMLDGDRVTFTDGDVERFDAIIYATGYNLTFPFFDPDLICAPRNVIRLHKRMFKPGIDDVVFIGFGQALPTLFPFVECQAALLARYLVGKYRPPEPAEMETVISADERRFTGHFIDRPRHSQQLDYFAYERDLRVRELPAGRRRVQRVGPVPLAGRAVRAA